jgi:hypothetical protein
MPTFTTDTHDISEAQYDECGIVISVVEWMSVIVVPRTEGVIWPDQG